MIVGCTECINELGPLHVCASGSEALRRRNLRSPMSSSFNIIAVAFSTRLKFSEATARKRSAAKGDSRRFVVRRWSQCAFGKR